MKKLLFSLLFTPIFLAAQSGEPVDSSYFVWEDSLFFEIKTLVYPDAYQLISKTPIGDSTDLAEMQKARMTSNAATMAIDVRHVSRFKKRFTTLLRESDAVLTLTGIDPQREAQNEFSAPFLLPGWTIKRNGATSDVVFTVNAQGALRFNVAATGSKAALLIGAALRLKNYPEVGTDTDVYLLENGVWVDATRSVILRPPGNDNPVGR
jgi:hypothetical protein